LGNQQERSNNVDDLSYHYGVFMGDGFTERYKPGSSVVYIGLKAIDKDFVEHYQAVMFRLTGQLYKMRIEGETKPNRHPRFRCRVGNRELVELTRNETALKETIPASVMNGTLDMKKSFIQGVMDSEAWISCSLNPIGPSSIQLSVGVTSSWIKQLHQLFAEVGVSTTKIGTRIHKDDPKYLKPRKDFHSFSIHIQEYVDAGLSFNIKRKRDRLEYCSRILRDFTREYPRYKDYFG
jgi:hypothetical protein